MSAVKDATRSARDAVANAAAVVADLERQLAAIAGWLRVGDPGRHADSADRLAATEAVALADTPRSGANGAFACWPTGSKSCLERRPRASLLS